MESKQDFLSFVLIDLVNDIQLFFFYLLYFVNLREVVCVLVQLHTVGAGLRKVAIFLIFIDEVILIDEVIFGC
jgi:hypothetical protein